MDAAPNPSSESIPPESSSLADRLANVIAAPGEVFAEIKNTPARVSNWLVPLTLACIATVVYLCVAFSQPAVQRAVQEQRENAMRKQVAAGKITQAQADQATAVTERLLTPTVLKMIAGAGAVLAMSGGLFLMALAIWIALKYCAPAKVPYRKVLEVCGLSLVIDVPQKALRLWLVMWKQNLLATASPTLFLENPSTANRAHVFLSMIDVVDFWWLAVLSLGVSRIASIRYRNAAFIVFGVWFGFRIVAALLTPSQS
jgi:hypothetical protein